MLAMTQQAAEAVEAIIAQPDVPDTAVLRITAHQNEGNGAGPVQALQLELVSMPPADDVQVEDMPISVEPQAAALLEDKVLDAEVEDDGVKFNLYERPDELEQDEPA
jgi:Fe-S cluster assembly iron-binding protein IscA